MVKVAVEASGFHWYPEGKGVLYFLASAEEVEEMKKLFKNNTTLKSGECHVDNE